jgi:hypothetical protein
MVGDHAEVRQGMDGPFTSFVADEAVLHGNWVLRCEVDYSGIGENWRMLFE